MSQKIHIGKNGPAPCHASKRPCRLGQHYDNYEEADKAFDAQQSSETNVLQGVSKKIPVKKEDSIMTVNENGTKKWRNKNGELHRSDGPAIERANGIKQWYLNGKFHRTDGPAIEQENGTKIWYQNGVRHRTDGPATENADGSKEYWVNGARHRVDGPAVENADGSKQYWVNNYRLSEKEYKQKYGKTA